MCDTASKPSTSPSAEDLSRRSDAATVQDQRYHFVLDQTARVLLDAVPGPLLVINRHRQIVYANTAAAALAPDALPESLFGVRPGEALACRQALCQEEGCGHAEACRLCGLGQAATDGLAGAEVINECRVSRAEGEHPESLDLRVHVRPIDVAGERFAVVALSDIGDEKRRAALEHIFFHDLINTVGCFDGFLDLLGDPRGNHGDILTLLRMAAGQALDEIRGQQLLLQAENGALRVKQEFFLSAAELRKAADICRSHPVAEERQLLLADPLFDLPLQSDSTLLRRILHNLLLNALEASPRKGTVTAGCREGQAGSVVFSVHNEGVIAPEVQLQLFQRSFTTKGPGRGLGTYSIRLLAGYLGATVAFTSTADSGTEFTLTLPKSVRA
ncbi:MAG: hypothetical protein A2091_12390 [Desulfuromonadales bacterium GWD2_61_12]|nr:MAG: hypothetical protein A2005_10420 [Desulfuromonadales bacterium GWC2_61_20]OGR35859.1 MAG: hypothetical protein A2091_12390 [Desulfuromonadales bacterium GWD2_61_12]HBT82570.1 histidine kinase [Desulfuromonas sp.]